MLLLMHIKGVHSRNCSSSVSKFLNKSFQGARILSELRCVVNFKLTENFYFSGYDSSQFREYPGTLKTGGLKFYK